MYLTEYLIENVGPIEFIDISLLFNDDRTPQPLVLVGVNGSGKSIFISYIVDALTEFAKVAYTDILVGQQANFSPYFKLTGSTNQRLNTQYGIGLIEFSKNDQKYSYVDKSGNLEPNTYNEKIKGRFQGVQSWFLNENNKLIAPEDKKAFEDFFRTNAVCYFPPSRKELPHWLNRNSLSDEVKFFVEQRLAGRLGKPIFVESSVQENKSWLLDVFLDSMMDFAVVGDQLTATSNIQDKFLLRQSRNNVEALLRQVLQDEAVQLTINYQNLTQHRLCVAKNNVVVIPSLDHLSSGQSVLFNMFATIIRYADKGDIRKSINLTDIEGIVIIDEIDVHLHTELQYKVLPKLLKLFPKVQFIITSHSPLFLLGMEEEYGEQGFKIIEMPKGEFISTERFSEFKHSFSYYKQTKIYEDELRKSIEPFTRPILVTEGKTDAQIIRTACKKLFPTTEMNFEVIPSGIQIQESERVGSAESVRRTLEFLALVSSQPIIGLFDNDREGNEQFKGLNKSCFEDYDISKESRKHRSKDAWGLLLPVPASRSKFVTPDDATQRYLVIEHYFSDVLLKKHNKYGKNILGTEVFTIIGDKDSFANKVISFDVLEFENFKHLFEKIENLLSAVRN